MPTEICAGAAVGANKIAVAAVADKINGFKKDITNIS
jgi:hypothetical protein